jgi:hypothetical protein
MRLLSQLSATYLRSTAATSAIFNPTISYFSFHHAASTQFRWALALGEKIFIDN